MSAPKGIKRCRIDEPPGSNAVTCTPAEKIRLYHGKRAREDDFTGNGHGKTKISSFLTRISIEKVLHSPAAIRGFLTRATGTTTRTTPSLNYKTRKFHKTTPGTPASRATLTSSRSSFTSNSMNKEDYNARADRFQNWIESAITKAKQAISDNRLDILRERREKPRETMRRKLEERECERREELYGSEQERIGV
ncbi:hypothetical protein RUND412_000444 [Rhizina undulata]